MFITFHGHEGRFPLGRRHLYGRKVAEALTRGNICVGHFLEKWYGTRSNLITYGAVDPPRLQITPECQSIVFVGRVEEDTGIRIYLQALHLLRQKTSESWKLYICGDGPLRTWAEEYAREHGLNVDLLGWVQDPSPWVQRSRFVFSSGYLAMLEAMISRRLVFCVYQNPVKRDYLEMIPDAEKMLVISGHAEGLAGEFERVLRDPNREACLVDKAFRFAERHSWENLADTYLKLYEPVMKGPLS
jgi:glycosyltransferase involved in cell wall biosynthesis